MNKRIANENKRYFLHFSKIIIIRIFIYYLLIIFLIIFIKRKAIRDNLFWGKNGCEKLGADFILGSLFDGFLIWI